MAKLLEVTTGLLVLVGALAVVSVVFNILTWVEVNKDKEYVPPNPPQVRTTVLHTKEQEKTNPITTTKEKGPTVPKTDPITTTKQKTTTTTTKEKTTTTTTRKTSTLSTTTKLRTIPTSTVTPVEPPKSTLPPVFVNDSVFCPSYGVPDESFSYKQAASYILSGIDSSVDPCEDFYAFTCNTYLKNHNATMIGVNRLGSYREAQEEVNSEIVDALEFVDIDDEKVSETERIVKAAMYACVYQTRARKPADNSIDVLKEMKKLIGRIPFLNHTLEKPDFFTAMGELEQNHAMGTLMSAMVSVDFKDVDRHSLYISQPHLPMPREFYVLSQHTKMLEDRAALLKTVMREFAELVLYDASPYMQLISEASKDLAKLEMQIAMASWPDSEMRNYAQQNNPYTLKELEKAYPAIKWRDYLKALLSSVERLNIDDVPIIITQPSYFGWLNALFSGGTVSKNTIANYLLVNLIFEEADFLGGNLKQEVQKSDYVRYALRRGKGVTKVGRQFGRLYDETVEDANLQCLNTIMLYMPFGPGYVYVKTKENREEVVKDVKKQTERVIKQFLRMISQLEWMDDKSLGLAQEKVEQMVKNYGWPKDLFGDFKNSKKIDDYHKKDYGRIIDLAKENQTHEYYEIRKTMIKGFSNVESLKLLKQKPDRHHFLLSPALVNAWYQPERNSITFPYAAWNPPYYNYGYPQAYNYAGQGGTAGHELVHGFDDQGVQFGPNGTLSECNWVECGWMTPRSKKGFNDMAECVVTQYSTQCCPEKSGNIQCANGMTTQGENIADLGGQLAAYYAYREYIEEQGKEEKRLPGLEQYTPNQIFWMTYGFSWCMSQSESSLVTQILTNPHAPGSCRVNQVMQDIPEFGHDFGCLVGQNMYPEAEQRCPVWVAE